MTNFEIVLVNGKIPVRKSNDGVCHGCGKSICWGVTDAGKKMPFDSDENHTAHWATCSKASNFRKAATE